MTMIMMMLVTATVATMMMDRQEMVKGIKNNKTNLGGQK